MRQFPCKISNAATHKILQNTFGWNKIRRKKGEAINCTADFYKGFCWKMVTFWGWPYFANQERRNLRYSFFKLSFFFRKQADVEESKKGRSVGKINGAAGETGFFGTICGEGRSWEMKVCQNIRFFLRFLQKKSPDGNLKNFKTIGFRLPQISSPYLYVLR